MVTDRPAGPFAVVWLYATALLIGLGLGPVIAYLVGNDPTVVTQAAGGTALIVLGMGSLGFALSGVSLVMVLFGGGGNPILSLVIAGVSALLILVDFNYLRTHGTADQAVLLATGIFVSIVNIFISLLNIFSSD